MRSTDLKTEVLSAGFGARGGSLLTGVLPWPPSRPSRRSSPPVVEGWFRRREGSSRSTRVASGAYPGTVHYRYRYSRECRSAGWSSDFETGQAFHGVLRRLRRSDLTEGSQARIRNESKAISRSMHSHTRLISHGIRIRLEIYGVVTLRKTSNNANRCTVRKASVRAF